LWMFKNVRILKKGEFCGRFHLNILDSSTLYI
jgi:hypothetical protein